jgi:hypothetical protein
MAILQGFIKTIKRRLTNEGYKWQSEKTSSQTVVMGDGTDNTDTAEKRFGAINGITSSLNTNNDNYALSAAGGYTLQSQVNELNTNVNKKQDASTAITTRNIGQQSVKYASSAGTAANASKVLWSGVQGKPSTYPPSSHSHDYLPNNPPCIEIFGQGGVPFIDFHYGGSSADYTSRLIDASSTFNYLTNSGIHQFCNGSGSQVARIQSNGTFGALSGGTAIVGSAIYCQANWSGSSYAPVYGTSFTNPSSRLVKENVTDMSEEEAKKVLLLNPIEFNYIKEFGGEKNQRGLIAEDALDIIPSCVTVPDGYSEEDFDASKGIQNKVLAIDYSKLVPYLIKMVQIQQEELEKIKEQLNN